MTEQNAILVILDGIGDRPVDVLDGQTPLQHARTPTLDALARDGVCGIMDVVGPGRPVGSDVAHLILFGYDFPQDYPGRGPLEALGVGLDLQEGDIAFRGNLAHVDHNRVVIDRRAGRRIPEASAFIDAVNRIPLDNHPDVHVEVRHSTEQRVAGRLRGPGLSDRVSANATTKNFVPMVDCAPLDESPEAKQTAAVLNELGRKIHAVLTPHPLNEVRREQGLPLVNALLVYGFGKVKHVVSLTRKHGIMAGCVTGNGLVRGVCRYIGMDVIPCPGATGTIDTDLHGKVAAIERALPSHDLLFLHVKATDSTGHDKQPVRKARFIEAFDEAFASLVEHVDLSRTSIIVTGDHSTPCPVGDHSGDPVPVLARGPAFDRDAVARFDEIACPRGSLGRFRGRAFMDLVMTATGRAGGR